MGKHIAILLLGSRGDIQPYIALGAGLKQAGHTVRLVAPHTFETIIRAHGLDFFPTRINPQEELKKPEVQALFKEGILFFKLPEIIRFSESLYQKTFEDFWHGTEGVDAIIATSVAYGSQECADVRGIPIISTHLAPLSPTRAFSNFYMASGQNFGPLNPMTHYLMEHAAWQSVRGALNRWRTKTLDLPAIPFLSTIYARMRAASMPILYGYSPSVVPKPADWQDKENVTGYWFLDSQVDYQPPDELVAFLNAGPKPVYVGFGSMSDENPEQLSHKVITALRQAKQRIIMTTGWGSLTQHHKADDVYILDSVPHDWLFPRVAAALHHGGAGTTGASLRAGIPTLITPFLLDQYGWATVVAKHGVGVKLNAISKVSVEEIANAVRTALTDSIMQQRAAELGARIRAENGVSTAVGIIDRSLA